MTSAGSGCSISNWLDNASKRLGESSTPRLDAELLLASALGQSRTWLYTWPDALLDEHCNAQQVTQLEQKITRRASGEPIAYILGEREFWSLPLQITADVLVPRAETECLVERALLALEEDATGPVLELGTGSGAIAIALASECDYPIVATDISEASLAIAQRNADRHVPGRIQFVPGNWFEPFLNTASDKCSFKPAQGFGLIISNPPYLSDNDPHLAQADLPHEPRHALVSGEEGLDAITELIVNAPQVGTAGCRLILEHGATQAAAVRALMAKQDYIDIETLTDLAALDRITTGRCPTNQATQSRYT